MLSFHFTEVFVHLPFYGVEISGIQLSIPQPIEKRNTFDNSNDMEKILAEKGSSFRSRTPNKPNYVASAEKNEAIAELEVKSFVTF